jgi:hypothetical protein
MSTILSTQGVQMYILDDRTSPDTALEIDLMNGFNGFGGDAKKIDTTTFSNQTTMSYKKGLIDPKQITSELIFAYDSPAHQYLLELQKRTGTTAEVQILVGQSDGTSPPTVVTGNLTPPSSGTPATWSRSCTYSACFVMTVSFKEPVNEVVRADLTIQPTGEQTSVVKGEQTSETH